MLNAFNWVNFNRFASLGDAGNDYEVNGLIGSPGIIQLVSRVDLVASYRRAGRASPAHPARSRLGWLPGTAAGRISGGIYTCAVLV
jgi:hypothetical protein